MKTVERGAALLDERVPGWADRVNLGELDLASSCNCVLGQVFRVNQYAAYDRGLRLLGVDSRRHGFYVWFRWGSWSRLTAAWMREVLRRRLGES